MIDRRKFLKTGAVAGVGAMLPWQISHAAEVAAASGSSALAAVVGVSPAADEVRRRACRSRTPLYGFVYTPTGLDRERRVAL